MVADNIKTFNLHVLRAMAVLYQSHPNPVTLDHQSLRKIESNQERDGGIEAPSGAEYGALLWLLRNEFVVGDWRGKMSSDEEPAAAFLNAQIGAKAYRVISKPEQNFAGKPLGQVAMEVAASDNPRDLQLASDLVVRRLLDA